VSSVAYVAVAYVAYVAVNVPLFRGPSKQVRKQWTPLLRSCEHNAVLVCDLAYLSSRNDLENLPTGFAPVRRS
jgi:hypothetical protein